MRGAERPPRARGRSGLTALELIIGVAVLTTLGLVLLGLLRASVLSSGRSAEQAFLLSSARKVLAGGDGFRGMLGDLRGAAAVRSLETGALSLTAGDGAVLAYRLSPQGELLHDAAGRPVPTRTKGVAALTLRYYARGADDRVVESSAPAAASLVTVAFEVPAKSRTLRLLSGARLMNHP